MVSPIVASIESLLSIIDWLTVLLLQPAKAQTIAGHNSTYSCPQQIKNTYATPYAPGQHPPSQLSLGQPQQSVSSHWSPTLHTHQHIAPVTQRPEGQYSITPSNQSSPQRVQHVHQGMDCINTYIYTKTVWYIYIYIYIVKYLLINASSDLAQFDHFNNFSKVQKRTSYFYFNKRWIIL